MFSSHAPLVAVPFWLGVAALVLTGVLLLSMLLNRLLHVIKEIWRRRVLNRWRPLLMASLYEHPESLPPLSRLDLPDFLELWNHLHDSLGEESRDSLNRLAGLARVPAAVSLMLRRKNFNGRFLAARTAGNMRLAAAWDVLRGLLGHESPGLSLVVAQALVRIDPARAVPLMMPQLLKRDDWSPPLVTEILREAGPDLTVPPLIHLIEEAPAEKSVRFVRYLVEISPAEAAPLFARQLANPASDHMLIACLKALNDSSHTATVCILCRHSNWHVRVHAAAALGRIGTHADVPHLIDMLSDGQWWVRYRAALALARLPGMAAVELLHIKDIQTDRDARDMLHQVMAELDFQAAAKAVTHG